MHKILPKNIFILSIIPVLLVSACGTIPPSEPPAHRLIKPGVVFQLNQTLEIAPDKAAAYIQHGKIINEKHINPRLAHCRLVLQSLSESTREISPDKFKVSKVTYGTELVLAQPIVLAAFENTGLSFSSGGDGGSTAEVYITYFYVRSDKQPLVSYISCKHWEDPHDGSHLKLGQITATLGDIITINSNP